MTIFKNNEGVMISLCVILELVQPREEENFKTQSQISYNKQDLALGIGSSYGFFSNFPMSNPLLFIWQSQPSLAPPPPPT